MTEQPHTYALRQSCLPRLKSALATGSTIELVTEENISLSVAVPACLNGEFPASGLPVTIGSHTGQIVHDVSSDSWYLLWSIDVAAIRQQRRTDAYRAKCSQMYDKIKAGLDKIADEFNDYEK
jgi:hypothetical protein